MGWLWFDVEIGYYTTLHRGILSQAALWFDVEIGYYTTFAPGSYIIYKLWFDVEIGYYTTIPDRNERQECCDLM